VLSCCISKLVFSLKDFGGPDTFFARQDPLHYRPDPLLYRQDPVPYRQDSHLYGRQDPSLYRQDPALYSQDPSLYRQDPSHFTMSGEKELSPKVNITIFDVSIFLRFAAFLSILFLFCS
jgi:hypothetical protein